MTQKSDRKFMQVSKETYHSIKVLADKANDKKFGRSIRPGDVVAVLLQTADKTSVVEELQKKSMRPADFMRQMYESHCTKHGPMDYNEFLLKAITSEIKVPISDADNS